MSQPQGAEGGDADPQSQPPAEHLLVSESIDSSCPLSRAAQEDTAVPQRRPPSQVVALDITLDRLDIRYHTV